ncbi:hypothetical protein PABG_07140 [Paracoccidioides brasiliensis Pb03]|uniref:Uncharacterized protein n=3 Tax=Paracoccidioides TaxID=38946 RepID=C1GCW8_PARBD|nr:hypothetical protein PAAG_07405 [Paracoccidioides lutzii Pb01]XP_010760871.1 uncharacterized protein PADG_05104 [Paracoccidioides brasiliensis Pb18]EEH17053.1 hypothetical protein PABG_07140 [Paracoccidioides brasiliensis Pb03]ODH39590.1 hypothetical protein ACO22_01832 [Paracoccidioides brasiliensis]EEH36987.2 hypothetical protein PAAG_07405 [Paracoccidioides lutzii Pb01]EEH49025.1 hypothetical protein PADG_05104 [Paracoccidioides brasiliensis Pb18]ODH48440.1 hypothetical protein GX48_054
MKLIFALFSILAVAIAAPSTMDPRSDTEPAMVDAAGEVVPFDPAGVVVKK